ncbi:MAG: DUF4013 domain-containing protein [Anaerolineae bacterium]|jgi:hypothetical protein|nr:DUF4013 domain-containing protein [Anaerolineae bacterium]MDH7474380.1 DUF4013 domain-containing protein [Anaerolineae bacterium]
MDIGKAFTYVFEDEDWVKKVLLGGVINLIPIVGFLFTTGYMLETVKNVMEGRPLPLPEWDDWGGKFMKGLMAFVIGLVYSIPIIVVVCCLVGAMSVAGQNEDVANTLGSFGGLCVNCVSWLYSLVLMVVLPAVTAKYATAWELGAAFRFGEIFNLVKDNIGTYLLVLVISLLAGIVSGLGFIACGIGVLFTAFYAMLVNGYAYGQAYRIASTKVV